MTDLTLLLVEHVRDVRWTMAVDAGLEITPIETVNNLILSLSSQWGDTKFMVRDEILAGNLLEHPIEFGLYYQSLLVDGVRPRTTPEANR